jgi:hypothetical protein
MKSRSLVAAVILFLGLGARARADALTSVGDSFVVLSEEFHGMGSSTILYLGNDGTYKQLSNALFDGVGLAPTYAPSQSGTYTYSVSPDNRTFATLNLSNSTSYALNFTTARSGYLTGSEPNSFSFFTPSPNTFLTNVSNRTTLRPSETAISGFVIEGASRIVLVRTVGPSLAPFGVSPVSANPNLTIYPASGASSISGQKWGATTRYDAQAMSWIFGIAGAFQLTAASKDVVYFGMLPQGAYTAQTSDATVGATGAWALTEAYVLPYEGDPTAILEN